MNEHPSRRVVLGGVAGGVLATFAAAAPGFRRASGASPPRDLHPALLCGPGSTSTPDGSSIKGDVTGAEAPGFNDSAWSAVNTPHTWNAVDGADGGGNYYRGIGWYRRHVTVPANLAGKMLFLQFAGADQVADVWVNGTHLGQHQGGYSRFRFGATGGARLRARTLCIAVKVTNASNPDIAPLSADYTFQGGIYRNVSLCAVDKLGMRMLDYAGPGIYLRQRSVTAASATVDVTAKVFNNNSTSRSLVVRAVVTDAAGTIVADRSSAPQTIGAACELDVVQTLTIANPRRWNGLADPYLYSANVEVHDAAAGTVTDVVTEPLGLRTFSLDAGHRVLPQRRAPRPARRQPAPGPCRRGLGDQRRRPHAGLRRSSQNSAPPPSGWRTTSTTRRTTTSPTPRGVVVWAEIPLVNATTNSAAFTASTENQLRELIRQNYNHPSIAFWSIGNEQGSDDTPTNTLLANLAALVAAEDPDRICTYANDLGNDAKVTSHASTTGFNKYYGWYGGSYNDLGPWADGLHQAEPARTFAVSEYGAGANTTQHALNPAPPSAGGQYHPEEYQSLLHEASWKELAARPYIWGTFVWTMFDFASDARNEGGQPGINDKGLVTRDRATRKDAFYWYKANWAATPTLYITSRRWTHAHRRRDRDQGLLQRRAKSRPPSTAPRWARSASTDHIFRWTGVTLRPGANTVSVTASIGGATYTDSVVWTLTT